MYFDINNKNVICKNYVFNLNVPTNEVENVFKTQCLVTFIDVCCCLHIKQAQIARQLS